MCVVLVGGIENLKKNYIDKAQQAGIDLKVFTGHERQVGYRIGSPDAVIVLTKIVSHAAKTEVSQRANAMGVPVIYQKFTGLSHLRECFDSLVCAHNSAARPVDNKKKHHTGRKHVRNA